MSTLDSWLDQHHATFTAIRRDIHAHPELGLEEVRTAKLVADKLREWGVEVHERVGQTGVVGVIRGNRPGGRAIGLRADMDCLALDETTNLPYSRSIRAACMPAVMTGTPRCCWRRRAILPRIATSPAR